MKMNPIAMGLMKNIYCEITLNPFGVQPNPFVFSPHFMRGYSYLIPSGLLNIIFSSQEKSYSENVDGAIVDDLKSSLTKLKPLSYIQRFQCFLNIS